MFDSKFVIVVRDDLAVWQKLNVTAFLSSGVVGANPEIIGEPYEDGAGNLYHRLSIQPVIVLAADAGTIAKVYRRAMERAVPLALYIEEMFATSHDAANRAAVKDVQPEDMKIVGLALREDRKTVDKITRGAKLHA